MRCSFCDKSLNNKKIGLPLFNHFNNELIKDKNAYQVYECKYCNLIQKKKLDTLHKKLFVKNYQIKRVLPSFKKKTIYKITLKKILKKKNLTRLWINKLFKRKEVFRKQSSNKK